MPDSKLADLPAIAAGDVTADDILYLVNDPAGTPVDRKVTVTDLIAFGVTKDTAQTITGQKTFSANDTVIGPASAFLTVGSGGGGSHAWIDAGGAAADVNVNLRAKGVGALILRSRVEPASTSTVGLIVRGLASQTAALQQWQNSAGTSLGAVLAAGNIVNYQDDGTTRGSELTSGTTPALGVRAIFLAGAATIIPLVLRGAASQTADLLQLQNSSGAVLAKINSLGTGTFQATNAGNAALYAVAGGATTLALVARGAASQTANLQEWQNSGGTTMLKVTSVGSLVGDDALQLAIGGAVISNVRAAFHARSATTVAVVARGAASQTADLTQWQNSAAATLAYVTAAGTVVGSAGAFGAVSPITNVGLTAGPYSAASHIALVVRGLASQTANLVEHQNSSGTAQTGVSSGGLPRWIAAGNEQTTVGAAGAASALPLTPTKYLKVVDSAGTVLVIPAYASA